MAQCHIRPYQQRDFEALDRICRATLPRSFASDGVATRIAPFLWCHPYTYLEPDMCFVLVDPKDAAAAGDEGKPVGYIVGCRSVRDLAARWDEYSRAVLDGVVERPTGDAEAEGEWTRVLAYDPDRLLTNSGGREAFIAGHEATLHIDLLPPYQRQGWGRKLMRVFLASLENLDQNGRRDSTVGGIGVHVGVAGENDKVVPFYQKCGFELVKGGEVEGNVFLRRRV